MKRKTHGRLLAVAAGAGVAMALGTAAIAQQTAESRSPQRTPDRVYSQTCGYCHGKNVGPVILGRRLPAETVKLVVRHGQNGMPAFRQTEISPAELEALARWVEKSKARDGEHGQ